MTPHTTGEWIILFFACLGMEATAAVICWFLAGLWCRVFPR